MKIDFIKFRLVLDSFLTFHKSVNFKKIQELSLVGYIENFQMVVEEMNILTTIFLKCDNEKIFYPNSDLAIKPISNFNRSPDMSESVEFDVDISTSAESILALKANIKA